MPLPWSPTARHRGRRDQYRTTEPNVNTSFNETHQLNEARIKACISRFDSSAYTRVQFLRAVSHSVGAHAVPKIVPQIQTQRTTTKSTTTATATSPSQLSVNRSRRTCARCVLCSSATHDLLSCRGGTSVSVLPASLSLNNKLAVAQHAALTSAWSCVCRGSDMLLKLTMYCLRTICTVFLSLRSAFFDLF